MNYDKNISEKLKLVMSTSKRTSGVFSRYYKISRTKGIKILWGRYVTVERAKLNKVYAEAHIEALNLTIAKDRFYYVPKCYGVKILKIKDKYAVGILMQHLGENTLGYSNLYPINSNRIIRKLEVDLRKAKIYHGDLHEQNVMYYNSRWYVIDFGTIGIKFL